MTDFSLADRYKTAKISLTPEVMKLRNEAFSAYRPKLRNAAFVHLTRLYFGLPLPVPSDEFLEAFSNDATFSMVDNAREAAVMAGSLLEAALRDGQAVAGLAVMCASASKGREPLVNPELLETVQSLLVALSVSERKHSAVQVKSITSPQRLKISAEAVGQITGFATLAPNLQQISDHGIEATGSLGKQTASIIEGLISQNNQLREEVDILWWLTGNASRLLDRSFAGMDLSLAAMLSGFDLADLTGTVAGPIAVPAILQKALAMAKKSKANNFSLAEIVDSLGANDLRKPNLISNISSYGDICPLHLGLAKAAEIGASPAWHASFQKTCGLNVSTAFSPLDLAMQAMRERKLLAVL